MALANIGVIGLAVMGRNLVLNLSDHGFRVAVYNRTWSRTDAFLQGDAAGREITGAEMLEEFVASLQSPRVILLMVKAGKPVDAVIEQLLPLLSPGDIIVDGGNSHYPDTERRYHDLKEKGLRFLGMGISGGEEGARHGPSLMPGGDPEAWPLVREMFQAIAAKADGEPCCQWVGEGGAGHYVKMVHNGIEYGDMQLIVEAWQLLRSTLAVDNDALADIFARWNNGVLDSYLIEITSHSLRVKEPDGSWRVDHILDSAGQKGTGKWTAIDALEQGIPLTLIDAAVNARFLSALKAERERAATRLQGPPDDLSAADDAFVDAVHDALYASKIISYAQGFILMRQASEKFGWNLQFGDIALLWREGCIIRSRFLKDIKAAFDKNSTLENLLFDDFFADAVNNAQQGWRQAVVEGFQRGIAVPAFATALSFFDGYRSATLPANLIQAQRDYFGAHTYRRVDRDPDAVFHTHWTDDQSEEQYG
jgi:6-phosphogluconate dehydrogenase